MGDREQLSEHGIEPIVHLPGVGTNLQETITDHDEVSNINIWTLRKNHASFDGCTVLHPHCPRTTCASKSNIIQHAKAQVFPDSDEQMDDHILEHVLGHAFCTDPMDPNAVLDRGFKV
ncbi:hypothetical protein B0H14DRAFT_2609669 [Mycena olivaceomarginata]|nr:hypothetical protein B0H14DRAFT_2609669 [Mycena olivaceomarginata]